MANNNSINNPVYYILADGTWLEDALFEVNPTMVGPIWDACVYRHRAGHKDGEPYAKDMGKYRHYIEFYARRCKCDVSYIDGLATKYLDEVYARHGNPWETDDSDDDCFEEDEPDSRADREAYEVDKSDARRKGEW